MKVPFWANRQTQNRKNRLMQRSGDPDSLTFSQNEYLGYHATQMYATCMLKDHLKGKMWDHQYESANRHMFLFLPSFWEMNICMT